MQAQNIALFRHKNNGGGLVCLILRLNFVLLLQRVSNNSYGCRGFIAAVFGRFPCEAHHTVSDGKLCGHANPWAQQLWQVVQVLNDADQEECFLFLLDGRIMDIFGLMCFFFYASLTAQSFGIDT